MRFSISLLAALLILAPMSLPMAHGATLHVPADLPTIQEGINAAVDGDTVMVSPGTYTEWAIDFLGKAIVVMSTDPFDPDVVAATIVDGNRQYSVFHFHSGEEVNTVLAGFTIQHGDSTGQGGGIRIRNGSSPTITRNVITENLGGAGGGIDLVDSHAVVTHNQITRNSTDLDGAGQGAGIRLYRSDPIITNNVISENVASDPYGQGGGIYCSNYSSPTLSENTITDNQAWEGGGLYFDHSVNAIVTNTILWGNTASTGPAIYMGSDPDFYPENVVSISYSDVEGGISGVFRVPWDVLNWGAGMTNQPPDFAVDGYHLMSSSALRDAGDPGYAQPGATDIDDQARLIADRIDIGADEYREIHVERIDPPVLSPDKRRRKVPGGTGP